MNTFDHNQYNAQGQKHGYWVVSHADGCEERGIYVNGMRHGHWNLSGSNGVVSAGPYISGKQSGLWKSHGACLDEAEGTMVNGKRHGRWIFRTGFGLVSEGYFVDGELQGQLKFLFFDNGETKFERENGILVQKRSGYCHYQQDCDMEDMYEYISHYFPPRRQQE